MTSLKLHFSVREPATKKQFIKSGLMQHYYYRNQTFGMFKRLKSISDLLQYTYDMLKNILFSMYRTLWILKLIF